MQLLPSLLLFSIFLVQFANGCLKIRAATCQCPFGSLDSSNLESFYSNISSYPISAPISQVTSDNCSISVWCPTDYTLIVLDNESYTSFGENVINGVCDRSSQSWAVDGGDGDYQSDNSYAQFLSVCVDYSTEESTTTSATTLSVSSTSASTTTLPAVTQNPSCPCKLTLLDNSNVQLVSNVPKIYNAISQYVLTPPDIIWSADGCSFNATCPSYSMNLFDNVGYTLLDFYNISGSCDIENEKWNMYELYIGGQGAALSNSNTAFSTCTGSLLPDRTTLQPDNYNYSCPCKLYLLDETNRHLAWKAWPVYKYLLPYEFFLPIANYSSDGCSFSVTCPPGLRLNEFDSRAVDWNDHPELFGSCGGERWLISITNNASRWTTETSTSFATCLNYSSTTTTRAPTTTLPTTSAAPSTTLPTATQNPSCPCKLIFLDNSNVDLANRSDVYSEVKRYSLSFQNVTWGADGCSFQTRCSSGQLFTFDSIGYNLIDMYEATGVCDIETEIWRVDDNFGVEQFSSNTAFATCLGDLLPNQTTPVPDNYNSSCSCQLYLLNNANRAMGWVGSPVFQWFRPYEFFLPTAIYSSDKCSFNATCPPGLTLLWFDSWGADYDYGSDLFGVCNGTRWEMTFLTETSTSFATCLNFSSTTTRAPTTTLPTTSEASSCSCTFHLLDNSNLDLISHQPQFPDLLNHLVSFPDVVQSSDNCSVTLSCPDGNFLLIMNMLGGGWYTLDSVEGTCNPDNSTWSFVVNNFATSYPFSSLVAACVEFCPESATPMGNLTTTLPTTTLAPCQCNYIPLSSSAYIPTVNSFSPDNCTLTMSCGNGYTLAVLGSRLQANMYSETATAICQRLDTTWLIDGSDSFDSIEAYCRAPSKPTTTTPTTTTTEAPCQCDYIPLTSSAYIPTVNVFSSDNCTLTMTCDSGSTLKVFGAHLQFENYPASATAVCQRSDTTWIIHESDSFDSIEAYCQVLPSTSTTTTTPSTTTTTEPPCQCNYIPLTSSAYIPTTNVFSSDNCTLTMSCDAGYTVEVFGDRLQQQSYTEAATAVCQRSSVTWLIDGTEHFSSIEAYCRLPSTSTTTTTTTPSTTTTTEAPCQCNYIPLSSSAYIPTVNSFSADNCTLTMSCDTGYTLEVFGDRLQQQSYTEAATAVCQRSSVTWLIDGTDYFSVIEAYCRPPST